MRMNFGSLFVSLLMPLAALAQSPVRAIVLAPQETVVGQGHFCGIFDHAVVIQDVVAGKISVADSAHLDQRVVLTTPGFSGDAIRVQQILDVNADGCSEIVVADRLGAAFEVWFLRGPTVVQKNRLPVQDFFASSMIESDFLSDGKSGIFVANKRTGELNSYVMDSLGWSAHTLAGIGTHPGLGVAGIADWNLDGRADVLWHSSAEGSFALSLGSQRGLQAPTAMSFGSQAMSLLGTQDLNGDARPELVFYDPRGAPRGHIVVVGYDIQMGFIADEGIERSLNAALQDYMKDLGKGDWKVTVVNDPSGRYDNGVVLSLRNGLL